jgi:hypothetical protein
VSGGRGFSEERLRGLADYAFDRQPMPSDALAVLLWFSDFEFFRRHGRSISGATWVKGPAFGLPGPVYVQQVGEDWFQRYVRERCGPIPNLFGWLLALWAAVRYAR